MSDQTVVVFSGRDLPMMQADGGAGHWTADPGRVGQATYLICVRNCREQWAATDLPHGTACLVGKITGTRPSRYKGRIVIELSEYAEIHVPGAWKTLTEGQRFPVAYLKTEEAMARLGIDLEKLSWQPFATEAKTGPAAELPGQSPIAQAKAWLANSLGIAEESIEIIIRA